MIEDKSSFERAKHFATVAEKISSDWCHGASAEHIKDQAHDLRRDLRSFDPGQIEGRKTNILAVIHTARVINEMTIVGGFARNSEREPIKQAMEALKVYLGHALLRAEQEQAA